MLRSRGGVGYGYVNPQGYGGYVKGILNTYDELKVYVYAGQCGIDFYQFTTRFNGGGSTSNKTWHTGGAGGGASDIRLINGPWNNLNSLKSRIIVAGGGGGAQSTCGQTYTSAGHGGNLTGGRSFNSGPVYYGSYSNGGTQTSGGTSYSPYYHNEIYGSFGYGAPGAICGAAGGGGWYGGGSAYTSGGGGGSSYAAGYPGCNTSYLHSHQQDIILENVEFKQGVNKNHGYVIIACLNLFEYRKNTNIYDNISHNISDISFLF